MSTSMFFPSAESCHRFRVGPLAGEIDGFAAWLAEQGYAAVTGRKKLRAVGHLNWWMLDREHGLPELDEALLIAFAATRPPGGPEAAAVRELLAWLRVTGSEVPSEPEQDDPVAEILNRYECFLVNERGLRPNTVTAYRATVRLFLDDRFAGRAVDLRSLTLDDVHDFIRRSSRNHKPATTRLHVAALRSFIGHLYRSGVICTDLASGIIGPRSWRLSSVPKALEPDQLQAVLASCDRDTPCGRRDHAILLLLARLGLRACEVSSLTLDDVDWAGAVITVSGKGGRRDDLPLPHEVGEALVAYLRDGRPTCSTRCMFVTRYAPRRGLRAATVTVVVRQALARAGVDLPGRGAAHLLRHTFATSMLRNGASLDEIGQILRHQSADSTRIYAKVDIDALSPLAQPWPGGAS